MKIWDVPYGPYFMVAVMFFNWYTICSVLKFVLHYALDMKFIPNPNWRQIEVFHLGPVSASYEASLAPETKMIYNNFGIILKEPSVLLYLSSHTSHNKYISNYCTTCKVTAAHLRITNSSTYSLYKPISSWSDFHYGEEWSFICEE